MVKKNLKEEQQAIRTTIVGGRPPGCGQPLGQVPYGIEILVKKASVDEEFKTLLLESRVAAAEAIGLDLNESEKIMLAAVSNKQLLKIIEKTKVRPEVRPKLMGKVAAVMIAALGFSVTGCAETPPMCGGIRPPDRKELTGEPESQSTIGVKSDLKLDNSRGIRPDHPVARKLDISLEESEDKLTDETISELTDESDSMIKPEPSQNDIRDHLNNYRPQSRGIRPDRPSVSKGLRPDMEELDRKSSDKKRK